MFTDSIITMSEHAAWFNRVQDSARSKHLIYEYRGNAAGVVNVADIDKVNLKCYWGFYIGEDSLPKGHGLAMGCLALRYIFYELGIRKLCSEAFAFNQASINYHKKLGFLEEGIFKKHIYKNEKYEDVVCLAAFKETWDVHALTNLCFGGDKTND
jgi:UDP-4-amino-4,6-dideoxy-N-acetyl-beta-L-altrosamine N-acetyltransferase